MGSPFALFAPFLNALEEGVLFLDRERRLVEINRAATEMLGEERERVVGRLCPSLFKGTACARACLKRKDCTLLSSHERETPTQTLDVTLERSEGSRLTVRMWAILLPEAEPEACVAVILRDRTREVLLEEEVSERMRLGKLVGHGPAMRALIRELLRAAQSDATVLLQGESGTGKELAARALHENSQRQRGPYIRVHCAAFPEHLLESELFGHARGAFTGAESARMGRFEAAHGGTILLDEIGEISPAIQVKLLRVLQEREVERLGENVPRPVDVRVVAATNRDLRAMVRAGDFREDLYYRLNVLPIRMPALRERPEDVPLLAQTLLENFGKPSGRERVRLSEEALVVLQAYVWPGNVRELGNALEYALVHGDGEWILPRHLPAEVTVPADARGEEARTRYYRPSHMEEERTVILRALQAAGGNKVAAAKALGMSRTTLWKRLKRLGE
ncbi:MAG: sigma 54-interacting transcriptional regulator [Magnetococcales bacterium]|nr:sigma 54-interacting transcriptional regulator [Magnetococcales bacterium]